MRTQPELQLAWGGSGSSRWRAARCWKLHRHSPLCCRQCARLRTPSHPLAQRRLPTGSGRLALARPVAARRPQLQPRHREIPPAPSRPGLCVHSVNSACRRTRHQKVGCALVKNHNNATIAIDTIGGTDRWVQKPHRHAGTGTGAACAPAACSRACSRCRTRRLVLVQLVGLLRFAAMQLPSPVLHIQNAVNTDTRDKRRMACLNKIQLISPETLKVGVLEVSPALTVWPAVRLCFTMCTAGASCSRRRPSAARLATSAP